MRQRISLLFLSLLLSVAAWAGEGDSRVSLNAGILIHCTLNAQAAYERELRYGDAVELFIEAGCKYQRDPLCGRWCTTTFWDRYYWSGGGCYKKMLAKMKNSNLRLRIGPHLGAYRGDFAYGGELSFEYSIYLANGLQVSFMQKNQVNLGHGDTFRNGVMVGLKFNI